MKKFYYNLLDIKNPVLIEVIGDRGDFENRFRILYPDGKCEYDWTGYDGDRMSRSCFAKKPKSLFETLIKMSDYDKKHNLTAIRKLEIK